MAAEEEFPSECDVLVLGTGLVESIVGAACSRIGKRVIVLDRNSYYGGDWATFNFDGFRQWMEQVLVEDESAGLANSDCSSLLRDDEISVSVPTLPFPDTKDLTLNDYTQIPECPVEDDSFQSQSRSTSDGVHCDGHVSVDREPSPCVNADSADTTQSVEGEPDEDRQRKSSARPESSEEDGHPLRRVLQAKAQKVAEFHSKSRRFNIGLCVKVLLGGGKLVKLLVDSAVSRYSEFLALNNILLVTQDRLIAKVPSSRSDVFQNNLISMLEKRHMMRFLQFCAAYDPETVEFEIANFSEYLMTAHNLSPKVIDIIVHSVIYESKDSPTAECMSKLRMLVESLGRFCNSGYLWTLYGVGELPQCFSRLNAIFGGTFILGQDFPTQMIFNQPVVHTAPEPGAEGGGGGDESLSSGDVTGVITCSNRRISCKHLVTASHYLPRSYSTSIISQHRSYLRAVLITESPLQKLDEESPVSLISIPPPSGRRFPAKVFEESAHSYSCPEGFYLVQAVLEDEDETSPPKQQFDLYLSDLFLPFNSDGTGAEKPRVLFEVYFRQKSPLIQPTELASNLHTCSGPDSDLSFSGVVEQAEEIFHRMFPGEEFLPRAPDPGDVIIGGEKAEDEPAEPHDAQPSSSLAPESGDASKEDTNPP